MATIYVFDVDRTVAEDKGMIVFPHVKAWFAENYTPLTFDGGGYTNYFAFATNQGGVGLRYWMERDGFGDPSKYPTAGQVIDRLHGLSTQLTGNPLGIASYFSLNYKSKTSGAWAVYYNPHLHAVQWSPSWRKPGAGMLVAIYERLHSPMPMFDEMIFVGDSDDDRKAAEAASYLPIPVTYYHPDEFFGI